jgi:Rrf2 family protein
MISTKGRYAMRVMIDLAQIGGDEFVSLKSISERQAISMKYLEMIVAALNKGGLVKSQRGKDGGYILTKDPKDYSIGDIIRTAEGGLVAVACPECGEETGCSHSEKCLTYPIWDKLDSVINDYLDSISLADVVERNLKNQQANEAAAL